MSSSNNQLKETQIDRLSELPESLIVHILSFLEVKQSAITTFLAKRYRNLWRKSTRLVFAESRITPEVIRDFVARVNRTLLVISGANRNDLESFEIHFFYKNIYCSDVDAWIDFAIRNNVKQLTVNLRAAHIYSLPQMMFQNSNLKCLNLRGCAMAPQRKIEWQSLTKLTIQWMKLSQHMINNILSGCPALYFLFIIYCWGFNRLEVKSKSMYELVVHNLENKPSLHISAPYVHILRVDFSKRKLSLGNTSSLVDADINCHLYTDTEEGVDNVKELLEKIQHVKIVRMGGGYNQDLSSLAMIGYQFPQSARTLLSVEARTEKRSIHGIIGQLESSPNLEALVIEGLSFEGEPVVCLDPKGDLNCDLLRLKTITFKNFVDPNLAGEPMLTLARTLLKRAPALEKLNIEGVVFASSRTSGLSERFKIVQTLLSYPRSSGKAVVFLR